LINQKLPSKGGCFFKAVNWTLLVFFGGYLVLILIGAVLGFSDFRKRADAIVLLSGGGVMRNEEAARLFNKGAADTIVLTQTLGQGATATIVETRQQLVDEGVPSYKIQTATGTATSTFDEARQVAELAERSGFGSVLVVTDPYHTLRARILFTLELRSIGVSVRAASASEHWYNPLTWMFTRSGWRATITEIVKIGGILIGVRGG